MKVEFAGGAFGMMVIRFLKCFLFGLGPHGCNLHCGCHMFS